MPGIMMSGILQVDVAALVEDVDGDFRLCRADYLEAALLDIVGADGRDIRMVLHQQHGRRFDQRERVVDGPALRLQGFIATRQQQLDVGRRRHG